MFWLITIDFSQKSPHFPCELSEREVTSPSNLKVVGALDNYSLFFCNFYPFFRTTKRLSRTSTFLVSCPKGQVEKYVNVEAWSHLLNLASVFCPSLSSHLLNLASVFCPSLSSHLLNLASVFCPSLSSHLLNLSSVFCPSLSSHLLNLASVFCPSSLLYLSIFSAKLLS